MPSKDEVVTEPSVNNELDEKRIKREKLLSSLEDILAEQDSAICELYEMTLGE